MKNLHLFSLGMLGALIAAAPGAGQEPGPAAPCGAAPCGAAHGCGWTLGCFPRLGCPDDYCPHPYPRQCWPPYPPFYRCVPAGECGPADCGGRRDDRLTWWFIPTPRALRDALWRQP